MTTDAVTRRPGLSTILRGLGLLAFPLFCVTITWPAPRWPVVLVLSVLVPGGLLYARFRGGVAMSKMAWRDVAGMADPDREWHAIAGLAVSVAAGDLLLLVDREAPGFAATMAVLPWALARLSWPKAPIFCVLAALPLATITWWYAGPWPAFGLSTGMAGSAMIGLLMRDARQKVAAAQQLLASERDAQAANRRAEALAERQRLAREIHDILAHTLTAQVVQLEGARMLLNRGSDPAEVLRRVEQAQRLARDGLDETRRALESLRGDARPLPDLLRALAGQSDAVFLVDGPETPLAPEAALALERASREALTNARKHAPGARTTVTLTYRGDAVEVEILDDGTAAPHPELGETGGGYGLAGMRERAELLGGALEAGPRADGKGYRVWLRVPN
ncbi:two-component sensor histidine kinase [Longispora fulva]|uniref:histidine kinase n=1 Tax=Longispora fulva TaxID=619741 RepID=A0A8J7KGE3_9ACTN|nr:sensor histidine kinase [Longispora fulva]MBG6137265.1 signal transduction histidine kinase [Longispora fulva]GIG61382.1 two-component sensor histidine kinase [Longispora fulva]